MCLKRRELMPPLSNHDKRIPINKAQNGYIINFRYEIDNKIQVCDVMPLVLYVKFAPY